MESLGKRVYALGRQLFTASLDEKILLSERAQCFHLEFSAPEFSAFDFVPGQFVSLVADDSNGKQQTRAYSIASAPAGNKFSLCVNRVEGGFFSNKLCDFEPGSEVHFHGPHGLFTMRQPLTDSIFIATGTGVAPMRGFAEYLFPDNGEDRSEGRNFWLVYGTRHETDLYYQRYFERLAGERTNFHYLSTLSRPHEGWEGLRGYVQDHVAEIVARRAQEKNHHHSHGAPAVAEPQGYDIHAYICGLNEMVSGNRDRLVQLGWEKKQVIFERYD